MAQEELEKKKKEKAEAREKARKAVQHLTITSAEVEHGVKKIKILQTAKEESGSFLRDAEDSKRGNAARRRTPHRSHRTGADQDNRKNEGSEDPTGRNAARSTDGHTTTKLDRGNAVSSLEKQRAKDRTPVAFVYRWTLPQKETQQAQPGVVRHRGAELQAR